MSQNSPFKFLEPYTKADHDLFFGRDEEVEQLFELVYEAKMVLVYGPSGVGKTSLIRCGLANRLPETEWYDIYIRRWDNINDSLRHELNQLSLDVTPDAPLKDFTDALYLQYFRPIYLIFDQFEELYTLGTVEEQQQFINDITELLEQTQQVKVLIVIREEYFAQLYGLEEKVPNLLDHKLRVETMSIAKAREVIERSIEMHNIRVESPKEKVVNAILDNISERKSGIQLTYLQIYLDKLYQESQQ